jgi:hypothetical protein
MKLIVEINICFVFAENYINFEAFICLSMFHL